jgi:hypothetical protein
MSSHGDPPSTANGSLFVCAYVPTHVSADDWEQVGSAVFQALSATTASQSTCERYRAHAAAFAVWAHCESGASTVIGIFRLELIERYIEVGMPGAADSTRATRRSILRRIARHAHPLHSLAPDPAAIAYRRVRPPYAAHEVASYFKLAEAQPTVGRRNSLKAVLALGLGCGLDCSDLGWVRGIDVHPTVAGVEVRVG